MHSRIKVGGYTPFSATEYPGLLSAVVFVQGCPWRCGYCHNPHLQPRTSAAPIAWPTLLATLERRIGLLDAVVFCGGEPTMDPALDDAMREVRAMGFRIGLETAGIYPARLRQVLPLVDWVGLDVKAPFQHYAGITGVAGSGQPVRDSLVDLLSSGVTYECRTTVHPAQLPPARLLELAQSLSALGVRHYVLQQFRATGCQDEALVTGARAGYPGEDLLAQIRALFAEFTMRRSD